MSEQDVTIPRLPPQQAGAFRDSESGALTRRMPALENPRDGSGAKRAVADSDQASVSVFSRERRARLQSGIVLWARINAAAVLTIVLVDALVDFVAFGTDQRQPLAWQQLSLLVWLAGISVVARYWQLDARRLQILDVIATVASGFAFTLVVLAIPGISARSRALVFEVAMAHILMIRAAVVPSSGRRTLWLGALAILPGVVACTWLPPADVPGWAATLPVAIRSAVTIVASALASRRIYGLQKQVVQARRLGQYTLQEKIGTGGMGVVFKATHALLRRPTAIKLIRAEGAGENSMNQFEREAQLTSQLTHPSTIQIYDFGRNDSGVFYYAMEYLEGLTLHDLVELTGPQPAGRVITLLVQVCGSLAEAHAVGLVHRDIKPANIMVCERGNIADVVKVLDFGLAKMRGQPANLESRSGAIAGTPGFMAPEAIVAPQTVDGRSDLYAVGAVAYYLLTGEHLFGDRADAELLLDQLNTEPVPVALRLGGHFPIDLNRVLESCLAKDPRKRPQSAEELSERLSACADARGWSRAQASEWWSSHRELVQRRVREQSSGIEGASAVLSPAKDRRGRAADGWE